MSSVNIYLTQQSQTSGWQSDKREQFIADDIYLVCSSNDPQYLRKIQQSARKIESLGVAQVKLVGDNWQADSQWAFALGFSCVGKFNNIEFTGDETLVSQLTDKLQVFAWSREITNLPPADLVPTKLAQVSAEYLTLQAPNCVTSTICQGQALVSEGFTGIYHVGKGSANEPCLLTLDYNPTGDANTAVSACLVGKGITFDSGGYSIKTSDGMFDMKCDMGGAAVVSGALALAIRQGLNKRVKLFLCCAENMVSGNAFRLGDILTYKNGVTVEIANTDAEGRLVLADGLIAASETKASLIIDAATLTGAAKLATGGEYTAMFSLDNELAEITKKHAVQTGEPFWQLPLAPWHQQKCPSAFAHTANSSTQKGGGYGGASNAAGFLSRFVPNGGQGWLHLDLAAAYNGSGNSLWAAGATGQGIATIAALLLAQ